MEPSENDKALRTLNDEELAKILDNHQKWLQLSEYGKIHNKLGQAHKDLKADLSYCNFKSSDKLRDVELIQADLTGTDFQDAKLHRTAFKSANLAGVNFSGADLTGALFTEDPFESRLATIEEASKISRKLFAWLLGLMGFSLLTIFSTQDVQLILNKPTSPLPIIQTPIPLASFYRVTPFIIFALYLYFNMHQTHVWRLISHLPARFPDGTPLDQKIFPWLINIWSKNFFLRLKSDRGKAFPTTKIQNSMVVFLIWWGGPMVLFLFWVRYLPRHDSWGYVQGFLLFLSVFLGGYYYHLSKKLLKRETGKYKTWINYFGWHWLFLLCPTLLILILTCGITWFSISGNLNILHDKLKIFLIANLQYQELSKKPANWDPDLENLDPEKATKEDKEKAKKQLNRVKGANLKGINLRYAQAENAFLAKSKLQGAHLEEARLTRANLEGADLLGTHLERSNLAGANLAGASLLHANLKGVSLFMTRLEHVDIRHAIFLETPGLTAKQIRKARIYDHALYDNRLRLELGISNEHLQKLIPRMVMVHIPKLKSDKESQIKLIREWYCEYNLPECKDSKAIDAVFQSVETSPFQE